MRQSVHLKVWIKGIVSAIIKTLKKEVIGCQKTFGSDSR